MPAGQHFTVTSPQLSERLIWKWVNEKKIELCQINAEIFKIDLTDSSDFVMWKFEVLDICASIQTMNRRQQVIIKKKDTEIFQIFTIDGLNVVFLKQRKSKYNNFISISYKYNT